MNCILGIVNDEASKKLIDFPMRRFCAQKLYFTQKFREAKLLREI